MTIKTLQAGRALAAISVAAFHLSLLMGNERYGGTEVFRDFTRHGNLGVDFFFVLSGFIILFAHAKDIGHPIRWREYLSRRFVRVFPVYWLYTAVFVALLLFGVGTDAKYPSGLQDWATSLTLIRFSDVSPPLEVAWTLFHEIAFYATFSLLLLSKRLGIVALGIFGLTCLAFYHIPPNTAYTAANVYSSGMNLHFFFGMGAFWLFKRGGAGVFEALIGTFVVLVTGIFLIEHDISHLFLGLGFGLTLAGFSKMEIAGRIRVPALLGLVGDASYSIYLTHVSLEGALLKVINKLSIQTMLGNELTYALVLSMTIFLGTCAYLWVERPLLMALRKRRMGKGQPSGVALETTR